MGEGAAADPDGGAGVLARVPQRGTRSDDLGILMSSPSAPSEIVVRSLGVGPLCTAGGLPNRGHECSVGVPSSLRSCWPGRPRWCLASEAALLQPLGKMHLRGPEGQGACRDGQQHAQCARARGRVAVEASAESPGRTRTRGGTRTRREGGGGGRPVVQRRGLRADDKGGQCCGGEASWRGGRQRTTHVR